VPARGSLRSLCVAARNRAIAAAAGEWQGAGERENRRSKSCSTHEVPMTTSPRATPWARPPSDRQLAYFMSKLNEASREKFASRAKSAM
jgi:hypothetical protein